MRRPDEFALPTKRLIASRAGYVCAFPNCCAPTSGPTLDGERAVNVGEAAHITAAQLHGPRYDPSLTSEQRRGAENGIWMCATHATLVDRDTQLYTAELLRTWKIDSELRALRMLGQPRGCASGTIASVSPATRVGAQTLVLVDDQPIPFTTLFDPDNGVSRLTWFVSAFVIQFLVQKDPSRTNAVLEQLIVTVHESRAIPAYRHAFGVYPATTSLFYVEIDQTTGNVPREFRPTRFYEAASDHAPEQQRFPSPIILNDNVPIPVALRINAKSPGMYLVAVGALISTGLQRETLPILPPQWIIFEAPPEPIG